MSRLADLFYNQLREIAETADRERLSVWIGTFKEEFPTLYSEFIKCRDMPDAETALAYLIGRDVRFAAIKLVRNHMRLIRFVHGYMNEQKGAAPKQLPPAKRRQKRKRQ